MEKRRPSFCSTAPKLKIIKYFQSKDLFKFLLQSDNELLVFWGVTDFVFKILIKRVENYPDFEDLAHVIQHRRQSFLVKNNIKGKRS